MTRGCSRVPEPEPALAPQLAPALTPVPPPPLPSPDTSLRTKNLFSAPSTSIKHLRDGLDTSHPSVHVPRPNGQTYGRRPTWLNSALSRTASQSRRSFIWCSETVSWCSTRPNHRRMLCQESRDETQERPVLLMQGEAEDLRMRMKEGYTP